MTHLVLLGAGHAHVEVLRRAARKPSPGQRITLITRDAETAYSGLLPALIRGECSHADAHIACVPLAHAAGAALTVSDAIAIDLDSRTVLTRSAGIIRFDLLSIDVGGAVRRSGGIAVKPIGGFLVRLQSLEDGLRHDAEIAVIGAGAGGTELALALSIRLAGRARITLIGPTLLPSAPQSARGVVLEAMRANAVQVMPGTARSFSDNELTMADGTVLAFDAAIWATGVAAPDLLARSGLTCDPDGRALTDAGLRSLSHDFVFAAGDCAAIHNNPRPGAGVWAVRAGPVLAANLFAAAAGRSITPWRPQRDALAILSLGRGRAVAWRGGFSLSGRLPFWWKRRIDRCWMARYRA